MLWVAVLASALGVVYGKQEARNRFSELQKLTTVRDDLDIEWGQLQLEQSTWATHGRVEQVAHDDLRMVTPAGVRTAHRAAMRRSDRRIATATMSREQDAAAAGGWRLWLVGACSRCAASRCSSRAVYLQVVDQEFLERQGDARILRDVKLSANRGMVLDRNGEPLAVSTPVDTVWADPRKLAQSPQDFARLAKALDRDPQWLARRVTSNLDREFVYLVRHMRPADAAKVKALGIPGVDTLREYRRYYPAGEVTGHLLGFTNVDDVGQEGLELAFDQWLGGEPGIKRVMRDNDGRTIEDIERIKAPRPGQDLRTSIDLRAAVPRVSRAEAAVQDNDAKARLGRRARHRDRRSARDGQPAGVQPERPRAVPARRVTAIARPTISSSRARASSRSSSRRASRPAAATPTR